MDASLVRCLPAHVHRCCARQTDLCGQPSRWQAASVCRICVPLWRLWPCRMLWGELLPTSCSSLSPPLWWSAPPSAATRSASRGSALLRGRAWVSLLACVWCRQFVASCAIWFVVLGFAARHDSTGWLYAECSFHYSLLMAWGEQVIIASTLDVSTPAIDSLQPMALPQSIACGCHRHLLQCMHVPLQCCDY